LNDLGVVEEAVEDGGGGGDIPEEFAHSSMGWLEVMMVDLSS
jgi:hypothetical protein